MMPALFRRRISVLFRSGCAPKRNRHSLFDHLRQTPSGNGWREDVLEAVVDNGTGRVLPSQPTRLDATGAVREGRNTFSFLVAATLINLPEGISKPSGLLKEPKLIHEHGYVASL